MSVPLVQRMTSMMTQKKITTDTKRKNNVYAIDSHPMDSRFEINGEVSPTVTAKLAKGSADGPLVVIDMKTYAIEGNVVDRVSTKNGKGWCEDVSPTLNTQDRHAICFQLCGDRNDPSVSVSDIAYCIPANPMSDRGQAVCYRKTSHPRNPSEGQGYEETSIADTLNTFDSGESRTPIIVLEGNGSRPSHLGNGYSESETMYTLNTIEQHSVCYSVDCRNLCTNEEVSGTLQAKNVGGFSYNYLNPVMMEKRK